MLILLKTNFAFKKYNNRRLCHCAILYNIMYIFMSKPRCVAVVEMISKLAISDVSVNCARHLCRRKVRNLRRRSVLPIKWRTKGFRSLILYVCQDIKFRAEGFHDSWSV